MEWNPGASETEGKQGKSADFRLNSQDWNKKRRSR